MILFSVWSGAFHLLGLPALICRTIVSGFSTYPGFKGNMWKIIAPFFYILKHPKLICGIVVSDFSTFSGVHSLHVELSRYRVLQIKVPKPVCGIITLQSSTDQDTEACMWNVVGTGSISGYRLDFPIKKSFYPLIILNAPTT